MLATDSSCGANTSRVVHWQWNSLSSQEQVHDTTQVYGAVQAL